MPSFLTPLLETPERPHRLVNRRHGGIVASQLVTAFDSASRRRGLLKHASLPPGSAMVIAPCNSVHTFFMRFAIDVAFVARDGRVLKSRHDVRPWSITGAWRAFAVIELASGVLSSRDTKVGDVLIVE